MNRLLALFFLVLPMGAICQANSTSLEGKWRIIALSDNEIYYNLKTDSTSFSKELKQTFDEPHDSANAVALFGLMKFFFTDYTLVFGKDGLYQHVQQDSLHEQGTYTIDKEKGIIHTVVKRNDRIVKEELRFSIKGGELHIADHYDGKLLNLILEKIDQ